MLYICFRINPFPFGSYLYAFPWLQQFSLSWMYQYNIKYFGSSSFEPGQA